MSINGRSAESAATGEFVAGEAELREFVAARVWALEEGPRALFDRAVLWLIEQRVLLPGITVLARLVAEMRAAEHARIHALLANALTAVQLDGFDRLLIVPEGARTSELDQLRGGTVSMSGRGFQGALERAFAIEALGAGRVELPDVPPAKVAALARYGLSAKAPALRELSPKRRAAALLATVRQLEIDSVDDALDLFDLLMATKLLARAERQSDKAKLKSLPALRRAAAKIARALGVLLEIPENTGETVSLAETWDRIEQTVPRDELTGALEELEKLIPDQDDGDSNAEWRAELIKRYGSVTSFLGFARAARARRGRRASAGSGRGQELAGAGSSQEGSLRGAGCDAGAGLVAAAGVPESTACGGCGGSSRVHLLRARAAASRSATPGDLRLSRRPVGRPARQAAGRRAVGVGQAEGAESARSSRRARGAPSGAGRDAR